MSYGNARPLQFISWNMRIMMATTDQSVSYKTRTLVYLPEHVFLFNIDDILNSTRTTTARFFSTYKPEICSSTRSSPSSHHLRHGLKAASSNSGRTSCNLGFCCSGKTPGKPITQGVRAHLTTMTRRRGIEARMKFVAPVGAWFSQVGRLHQVHHLWQYPYG